MEVNLKELAELAKLSLSDEELELYGKDLPGILNFVSEVGKLENDFSDSLSDDPSLNNLREDKAEEFDCDKKTLIDSAPLKDGPYILVGKVINSSKTEK